MGQLKADAQRLTFEARPGLPVRVLSMERLGLCEKCICISRLALPISEDSDELALCAATSDVAPANIIATFV